MLGRRFEQIESRPRTIGSMRLMEVARFEPPDAVSRLEAWKEQHAAILAETPPDAVRFDVGRAAEGTFARVMVAPERCSLFAGVPGVEAEAEPTLRRETSPAGMTEREVTERILAAYQTYEAFGGRYRTCLIWKQPDVGGVEGVTDPFLLVKVQADSSGTAGELSGHATEPEARRAAQEWLGSDREVALEKVPYSAYNWLIHAVTGHSLR